MRIAHVAGVPSGDVQDCARCGRVLLDNRGIDFGHLRDLLAAAFPVGDGVIEDEHGMGVAGCIIRSGIRRMDEMRIEQLIAPAAVPCQRTVDEIPAARAAEEGRT